MKEEMEPSQEEEPLVIAQATFDAAVAELEALPTTLNLPATRDENVTMIMQMVHNIQASIWLNTLYSFPKTTVRHRNESFLEFGFHFCIEN